MKKYSISLAKGNEGQDYAPQFNVWQVLLFLLFKVERGWEVQVNG